MADTVRIALRGGVARITLNRPQRGNRVDESTAAEIVRICEDIELRDDVRVVLITAAGKLFCAGVESGGDWQRKHDFVVAVGALSVPVVAALNGDALGEGCELALAADLRITNSGARLALPQIPNGTFPRHGATHRLPPIVGRTRAMDLLLTGRSVTAREAMQIGLVDRVLQPAAFVRGVRRFIADLATKGPLALRFAKESIRRGPGLGFESGVRLEQDLYVLLQTTSDRREGIASFLARRRPKFEGR